MRKTRPTPASLLKIFLLAFIACVALASFDVLLHLPQPHRDSIAYLQDSSQRINGTITHAKQSGEHQQILLRDLEIDGRTYRDKILVFAPLFPERTYGDRVAVRCNLQTPEPFDGFAYDKYLESKEIYKTCFVSSAPLVISTGQGNGFKQFFWSIREGVIGQIDQTFGEPHASLLAGLLLGEQRFTDEWEEIFIQTGTSHVVAASGYNVTIVVFLLFGILTRIGVKRQQAFYALLVGIVGYVIMAGGEAAVIRAGVMGALVLVARQLGRKADVMNIILLTAGVMLAVNPFLLRYDVGFQLSMTSTMALIYFSPILDKKLRFIPRAYSLRESLSATLAATLFSLPIIFLSFGQISLIGPIANLFVLPVVPYIMALGAFAVTVSFASTSLGAISGGPAWLLLSIVLFIVKSLASLPFSSIVLPEYLHIPTAGASILLVVFLWRRYLRTKPARSQLQS